IRDAVSYEGQAAIELEQVADPAEDGAYVVPILERSGPFEIEGAEFVRRIAEDLRKGRSRPVIAARFHNGVARAILAGAQSARSPTGLTSVALTGGVFQNVLLLERAAALLEADGFRVLCHHCVPPNDGGICLGQAVVAAWSPRG